MELPSADTLNALCTLAGIFIGFLLKRERRLTHIETKLDIALRDLDAIALYVGTPRAIATKNKQHAD